jgi:hypothetical protein
MSNEEVKEFISKKEAKEYINNMPENKRKILRPQVKEEFTYKPYPHNRIILLAFNSQRLRIDGTFQR